MNYASRMMKNLFGTEERVYKGNVLSWDTENYTPLEWLISATEGFTPGALAMKEPMTIDVNKYKIVFNLGGADEQRVVAYVDARGKPPKLTDTELVEITDRFLAIPFTNYELVSRDGDRLAVHKLEIVKQ